MSEIQNFTDFLDNIDYPYEIVDTEENLKANINISNDNIITITWLQNITPAFEIEFPMVDNKVTCNTFAQVQKNINLFMFTKQDNFENIIQLVNDMFCQQNGIDWTSTFSNLDYYVDEEENLKIIAYFTEDEVSSECVMIEVKADYFIAQANNAKVFYRYDSNKNMAIKLPSLETCINSLVKLQAANPDKFELEQANPNQNIIILFKGEPEIKVEFALGLCASAFLFETLYINEEEINLDFQFKQPNQLFDYRDKCVEAYQEYMENLEIKQQQEQEQIRQNTINSLDNLVVRLFPNEEDVLKDYISTDNDFINLHLNANTHELNIIWNLNEEEPYTYEFDTEDCGRFKDIDELYESIYAKLVSTSTEEPNWNENPNPFEDTEMNSDTNSNTWEESEDWGNETNDSWVNEPQEELQTYVESKEEFSNSISEDNISEDIAEHFMNTQSVENPKTQKNKNTFSNNIGISLTESIKDVLQFTGANRSIRTEEVEQAEQDIKKILEPFTAAEILMILSHLM